MTAKRVLAVVVFAGVLTGTFAASKPTDFEVLTRVVRTTRDKVHASLPPAHRVAGPLAAFRAGDALPVEERVRVRIQTDKAMAGADVAAVPTPAAGEVRLKGVVASPGQKRRAVELAEGTAGVDRIVDELAVVEGK
jgi:hypothetical protein